MRVIIQIATARARICGGAPRGVKRCVRRKAPHETAVVVVSGENNSFHDILFYASTIIVSPQRKPIAESSRT